MWKNRLFRERINFYTLFKITGRNSEALINILHTNNIEIYKIKKIDDKNIILSIKDCQVEKFFAITKDLCYTIKRVKSYGKMYPVYLLLSNVFLCVGIIFFFVGSYISNNYIFEIKYVGSGSIYERQIESKLLECGIKRFSLFPSADEKKKIENKLQSQDNILFASIKKSGNYLIVNTVAGSSTKYVKEEKCSQLIANCDGVVEDIKVYRGVQLVSVGDSIKKGDVLVDGVKEVNQEIYTAYVKARVIVISEYNFECYLDNENDDVAILLAMEEFGGEIVNYNFIKEKKGEQFLYRVNLFYRIKYLVG